MITKSDVSKYTFREYRKVGVTKLSDELLPVGTEVETLEGAYVCAEPSRLAMDVNGNVYPVAESVFLKSYALVEGMSATSDPQYRVKPLVWGRERPNMGLESYAAETIFGSVHVQELLSPIVGKGWYFSMTDTGDVECASKEDGMAKAEAWYRAKLMPALADRLSAKGGDDGR